MSDLMIVGGLVLALIASLVGNAWQYRHAGELEASAQGQQQTAKAEAGGQLDRAGDANAASTAVIATLQQRLDECSAQLAVGETVAKAALAGVTMDREHIARELAAARARLAEATATGECRDWAAQPSCGVSP
jgi:hypothetical protein